MYAEAQLRSRHACLLDDILCHARLGLPNYLYVMPSLSVFLLWKWSKMRYTLSRRKHLFKTNMMTQGKNKTPFLLRIKPLITDTYRWRYRFWIWRLAARKSWESLIFYPKYFNNSSTNRWIAVDGLFWTSPFLQSFFACLIAISWYGNSGRNIVFMFFTYAPRPISLKCFINFLW